MSEEKEYMEKPKISDLESVKTEMPKFSEEELKIIHNALGLVTVAIKEPVNPKVKKIRQKIEKILLSEKKS